MLEVLAGQFVAGDSDSPGVPLQADASALVEINDDIPNQLHHDWTHYQASPTFHAMANTTLPLCSMEGGIE